MEPDWCVFKAKVLFDLLLQHGGAIEILSLMKEKAKSYRKGSSARIVRNTHMNDFDGSSDDIPPGLVDAILVDFINFIGWSAGVDYALYTKDLLEAEKEK